MDEKMVKQEETVEIDLKKLFRALLQKAWLLVLVSVTCATLALVYTVAFVTPQYQASATFFVNNGSLSSNQGGYSASDISASRGLVETYIQVLKTRETLQKVIDATDLDLTVAQLKGMVNASAVGETEIFGITVTHPDPQVAEELAVAITKVFPGRISSIIKNSTVTVVDSPVLPVNPVSPSTTKNTVLGFAIGLILAAAVVILREMLDVTIRSEEDIKRACGYGVLTTIPDMQAPSKGHYSDAAKQFQTKERSTFGAHIGFAASEAYKLLRTKLQYSFADEKNCYVIGISSAESGEGKSLTSINLAYSMAQLGKKVMLIDCDMRRPSISNKMSISRFPGLSSYLVKQSNLEEVIHTYRQREEDNAFHVITGGQTPPNPVELLSSTRMGNLLEQLRQAYDYVILDLPPMGEVSDALAISNAVDGILLVVRQNFCDRRHLENAVRQFEFVNCRVLGIVYNGIQVEGKIGRYKKYYAYGGRYAAKAAQAKESK